MVLAWRCLHSALYIFSPTRGPPPELASRELPLPASQACQLSNPIINGFHRVPACLDTAGISDVLQQPTLINSTSAIIPGWEYGTSLSWSQLTFRSRVAHG